MENFAKMKESSRKQFYDSRVSLNQSVIVEKNKQLVECIKKETELIERLKDTRTISEMHG